MAEKELKLVVAENRHQSYVNRGFALIDDGVMKRIGIKQGDYVEINGSRTTGAIAVRGALEDRGLEIIRIDGLIRHNAGTSIGEKVIVRRAEAKEAKSITIAPTDPQVRFMVHGEVIRRNLLGRPLTKGDLITPTPPEEPVEMRGDLFEEFFGGVFGGMALPFGLGEIKFVVTNTSPSGIVLVTDMTEIEVLPQAVEIKELKVPAVTYEDIGGLKDELQRVREMIELPLKHPEVFDRLGIEPPKGVLLHGPPGTGKTLIARAVANESGANFTSINGPEIMCVGGDTKIFTNPKGFVKAKDLFSTAKREKTRNAQVIELEKPIKTFAFSGGQLREAAITHVTKLTAPAYEVVLSDGSKIVCSYNQPFLVFEQGFYVWKPLKELRPGMFVARVNQLPLPEQSQKLELPPLAKRKNLFAPTSQNLSRSNWVRLPRNTSPALWEYIGLLMAEGHISGGCVTFCNTSLELREHYVNSLKKLFNIDKATTYPDGRVVIYSKALVAYLQQFNLVPGKKKPSAPLLLYSAPRREVAAFVRGYFEGDGTISLAGEYPTPVLFSASREFLHELQGILLLKLGIGTALRNHSTRKGMMYALVVRGNEGRIAFAKYVGAITREKKARLKQIKRTSRECDHIPTPQLLLHAMRSGVPYKAYRNNDVYVYERRPFTKHAMTKLYNIARAHSGSSPAVETEYTQLTRSDIAWERIVNIVPLGLQELYDFTVDKDSFVAAPYFILHNSKWYGESEARLREIFEQAEKNAPSIVFIDELDAIAPKREEVTGEVERRVVATLCTALDGLKARGRVIVIGATNRPNALDPAIRRPGRFDREIEIGVPDRDGRKEILQIHTRGMPLAKDVSLDHYANVTHGFVGADLEALAKEAAMSALRRILPEIKLEEKIIPPEVLEKLQVTKEDFDNALKMAEPSAMREVLIEVPNVRWEDVGGLERAKQELIEAVEWPLKYPDAFKRVGIEPPHGILLYGPPGTGKTMLARAVATESEANFISIKGPELLSKWVGESEKGVRETFRKAKMAAPAIIFFDEIDALVPRRGSGFGDSHVTERVISQLLTELDGLEKLENVVVIGATNRPDLVDPALLRPGRFDRLVLVPPPDEKARLEILKIHTKSMPLAKDVDLKLLAKETEGYSGSDIAALCREAAMRVLRKDIKGKEVGMQHFREVIKEIKPSMIPETIRVYESFAERKSKSITEEATRMHY